MNRRWHLRNEGHKVLRWDQGSVKIHYRNNPRMPNGLKDSDLILYEYSIPLLHELITFGGLLGSRCNSLKGQIFKWVIVPGGDIYIVVCASKYHLVSNRILYHKYHAIHYYSATYHMTGIPFLAAAIQTTSKFTWNWLQVHKVTETTTSAFTAKLEQCSWQL